MHRIDTDRATEDGLFQDGDDMGHYPTDLDADWFNDTQENICRVIEGAGLDLEKDNFDQLLAAIQTLVSGSTGPHITQLGEQKVYLRKPAETDFYKFPNGQHLALPAYQALADILDGDPFLAADAADKAANPGKWFISEDGTYLAMPDMRGQFERVDPADLPAGGVTRPALGHRKANQNRSHNHPQPTNKADGYGDGYVADSDGSDVPHSATTGDSGGDEAVPDHTSVYVLIRVK